MIDTIRFACGGVPTLDGDPVVTSGPAGSYWRGSLESVRIGGQIDPAGRLQSSWLEVSLQKLMDRSGSILGPDEHAGALHALGSVTSARGVHLLHVTRLDACGQIDVSELGGCGHVIRQLAQEPVAYSRRSADLYAQGEGVVWRGAKMVHRAYDKRREMVGIPGDVLRLEVQVRGSKKIAAECPDLSYGQVFDFWLKRWQRLPSIRPAIAPATWVEFVALMDSAGVVVNGQTALELALSSKSPQYARKFARAVRRASVSFAVPVRLSDMVPFSPPASWPSAA